MLPCHRPMAFQSFSIFPRPVKANRLNDRSSATGTAGVYIPQVGRNNRKRHRNKQVTRHRENRRNASAEHNYGF
jgi:hypothetical protein